MSTTSWYRRVLALLAAAMLLAGACSTKSDDGDGGTAAGGDGGDGGGDASEVETGPGVTDDTITLGVLTDQSGAFAALGRAIVQGNQLYWDQRNEDGGVCEREIQLEVRDHGYNAQNAVSLYAELQPGVLAFQQSLGSPMTTALLPNIESDEVLTMPVSWASSLLENPYIVMAGTTYDVEMINGLSWLMDNGDLAEGDTVGHIYLEGEYGENALAGSRYAAEELGLEVLEQKVQPTDSDMTAQVTAIEQAGASVILMTTTPPQAASAASVAEASGFDVTILGSNPTFNPTLLDGAARTALEERFYLVASSAPYSSEAEGPTEVQGSFEEQYPDETRNAGVMYGYGAAEIMGTILDTACDNGALTRAGLLEAFQSLSSVDTRGLIAELDYSTPGEIPAKEVYVARPSADIDGGLEVVEELFASELAQGYSRG